MWGRRGIRFNIKDIILKMWYAQLPLVFKKQTRNGRRQENDTKKLISPQTQEQNVMTTQLQHPQL